METRESLAKGLRAFDWFYAYSDDHRAYTAGRKAQSKLIAGIQKLACPFSMPELKKWAHNMILEDFVEESPGEWFRHPRKYKCIAPVNRRDLMTRDEWEQINNWMENKDEQ